MPSTDFWIGDLIPGPNVSISVYTQTDYLTVSLGHALNLILLLDGVAAVAQRSILISQRPRVYMIPYVQPCTHTPRHIASLALAALDPIGALPPLRFHLNNVFTCVYERRIYLLEEPLAAFTSSSARHSAMVLMLRKAASRAPVVMR
jgi:hypothetical protein